MEYTPDVVKEIFDSIREHIDYLEGVWIPKPGIAVPFEDLLDPEHCSDYKEGDCEHDPCPDCMLNEGKKDES